MTETVVAEDAPLGVQLWPTHTPAQGPNFTLDRVETVRTPHTTYVRWVYANGATRVFPLGEQVAVQIQTEEVTPR